MSKLLKLPNGDWVAPSRVSSIQVLAGPETDLVPSVIVRTMDGARIMIAVNASETFEMDEAIKLRDQIAGEVGEALFSEAEKMLKNIGADVPF